jgi:hypothetical protein
MQEADAPLAALCDLINRECQAGLSPDQDGSLHLRMADDTPVAVSQSPDGMDIIFHSTLAVMDRPRDAVLMMAALALNLHQEQTGGGAVGLDLDSQALVYSLRVAGGPDTQALALQLEQFCSCAQHLRRELEGAGQALSPGDKTLFLQQIENDLVAPADVVTPLGTMT